MGIESILNWTFYSECPLPNDVKNMLIDGEEAICAYKTIRDVAIFTNKRLIVRDAQIIDGKISFLEEMPNLKKNRYKKI